MKFEVQRERFSRALSLAEKITAKRQIIPVLSNVLLRADRHLLVAASDLASTTISEVECSTERKGEITIPAAQLAAAVASFSKDVLTVEVTDNIAKISAGRTAFSIPGMIASDFPRLPVEAKGKYTIDSKVLGEALTLAAPFGSQDEYRNTSGVLIDDAYVIACDTMRMARLKREHGVKTVPYVLPKETAKILGSWLAERSSVAINDDNKAELVFLAGPDRIAAKMLDREYPNTLHLVQKEYATDVVMERSELVAAVDRMLIASPGSITVKIVDNEITFMSRKSDAGAVDVATSSKKGSDLTIGFNGKYFRDVLELFTEDGIRLRFNGDLSPVTITKVDGDDDLALLMPERL